MSSFECLEVWKRAVALSADLYRRLKDLRDYGFKDQITCAGLSIASNIAEGMERDSKAEQVRYLTIARSSSGEVRTQAYVGIEVGYIHPEIGLRWIEETREISAMLIGLSRSIRSGGNLPSGN
jgi:four helix bundle protein